jgi:hypothetical protein
MCFSKAIGRKQSDYGWEQAAVLFFEIPAEFVR